MRIRFLALLAALLAMVVLSGCTRVKEVYFVSDPSVLAPRDDAYLDVSYVSDQINRLKESDLVIEFADPEQTLVGPSKIAEGRDVTGVCLNLEQLLSDRIWRTEIFHDVGTIHEDKPIAKPTVKLRVALTRWHEGSSWQRAVICNWAGATRVQIEGEFIDMRDGQTLASFADLRVHPGRGFLAYQNFKPRDLIEFDLINFTNSLQRALLRWTDTKVPRYRLDLPVTPRRPHEREAATPSESDGAGA